MAVAVSKETILEVISQMTVMEIVELTKAMEEKFNVSAAVPVVSMGGGSGQTAEEEKVEEQTEFAVHLVAIGEKKLEVIRVVRATVPSLALKEAKDLVESAPKLIKEGLSKADAEELKKKLEAAGATVEVK